MTSLDIPITHVFRRVDARKLDQASLRGLTESVREIGIINPLRVRPVRRHVDGVETDAWEVTAGAHRLAAALKLGLETVPCIVVEDSDLRAELAMIDENLMRAELSPADRAKQTARRKELYEELHQETKHGGDHGNQHTGGKSQTLRLATNAERFTADTAAATGKSERVVQLYAERGEKIAPDVLDKIKGTRLDRGNYLDELKKLGHEDQRKRVDSALANDAREAAEHRRAVKLDTDVKARAAREVAEVIAQHVPGEAWDGVKANLYAAGAKNIADALTNITGQAIMDRRYGEVA